MILDEKALAAGIEAATCCDTVEGAGLAAITAYLSAKGAGDVEGGSFYVSRSDTSAVVMHTKRHGVVAHCSNHEDATMIVAALASGSQGGEKVEVERGEGDGALTMTQGDYWITATSDDRVLIGKSLAEPDKPAIKISIEHLYARANISPSPRVDDADVARRMAGRLRLLVKASDEGSVTPPVPQHCRHNLTEAANLIEQQAAALSRLAGQEAAVPLDEWIAKIKTSRDTLEGARFSEANHEDSDCEPHWSNQLELSDGAKALDEILDALPSLFTAPQPSPDVEKITRERDILQGELVARAKVMTKLYDTVGAISDDIEDEGDRCYFGSTNDVEKLKSLQNDLESWHWADVLRDSQDVDPFETSRKAIARAEASEAEAERLRTALEETNSEIDRIKSERSYVVGANDGYDAANEQHLAHLQEVADGAWGDDPRVRGLARDQLAALSAGGKGNGGMSPHGTSVGGEPAGIRITGVGMVNQEGLVVALPRPFRHHHLMSLLALLGEPFIPDETTQGFMTNEGHFVDRREALVIVKAARQPYEASGNHDSPELYSEDVW